MRRAGLAARAWRPARPSGTANGRRQLKSRRGTGLSEAAAAPTPHDVPSGEPATWRRPRRLYLRRARGELLQGGCELAPRQASPAIAVMLELARSTGRSSRWRRKGARLKADQTASNVRRGAALTWLTRLLRHRALDQRACASADVGGRGNLRAIEIARSLQEVLHEAAPAAAARVAPRRVASFQQQRRGSVRARPAARAARGGRACALSARLRARAGPAPGTRRARRLGLLEVHRRRSRWSSSARGNVGGGTARPPPRRAELKDCPVDAASGLRAYAPAAARGCFLGGKIWTQAARPMAA